MYAQSGPRNMQLLNSQIMLGPWRNRTRGQRKMWRCSGSGEALGGASWQITRSSTVTQGRPSSEFTAAFFRHSADHQNESRSLNTH